MGTISRRRLVATSATISIAVECCLLPMPSSAGSALGTAFSCGSRWTEARTCTALCPAGDDDACPPGQYCYGGIPCEGNAMEEVLERQRHLERREVNRLALLRDEDYVDRFVCGTSHDGAAESCAAAPRPSSDGGSPLLDAAATTSVRYCPSGSSSRCPAGTECYAAVSCPRSTHDEEPSLIREVVSSRSLNSFLATEPVLLNYTDNMEDGEGWNGSSLVNEEWISPSLQWSSFFVESSSAVLGTVSALLSSRYGMN